MQPFSIIFFLFPLLIFATCKDKGTKMAAPVQRDTTITRSNAVSTIFFGSAQVENFFTGNKIGESTAALWRNFYRIRNYQFAWFTNDGLAEQGQAFWNLYQNSVNALGVPSISDTTFNAQMEGYLTDSNTAYANKRTLVNEELSLTQYFFKYATFDYAGRMDPAELQWHIPRKKIDVKAILDSLIASKGKNIDAWETVNRQHKRMDEMLQRYDTIDKAGGWKPIPFAAEKSCVVVDSASVIAKVKQRLAITGGYNVNGDTSYKFTAMLEAAIKQAEQSFGLKPDGRINPSLVTQLNIPVGERIQTMLVNIERMRWLPKEPTGTRLVANIPGFKLHVFDSGRQVFSMATVVGTALHKTVIFSDPFKYVVFSPYWNVPRSIVRDEIYPAMQRDKRYLARHNMEQTGFSNGLPVIRQKPGSGNALGKVKFIIPNSYSIYFHDTPTKWLFAHQKRAFSHGCVRLAEHQKMAEYLLRNQPAWTAAKILQAMDAGKEKWVPVIPR